MSRHVDRRAPTSQRFDAPGGLTSPTPHQTHSYLHGWTSRKDAVHLYVGGHVDFLRLFASFAPAPSATLSIFFRIPKLKSIEKYFYHQVRWREDAKEFFNTVTPGWCMLVCAISQKGSLPQHHFMTANVPLQALRHRRKWMKDGGRQEMKWAAGKTPGSPSSLMTIFKTLESV